MQVIQKQTLVYLDSEDRLQLVNQCSDGTVSVFWLTRRLADRVVRALFHRLQQEGASLLDESMPASGPGPLSPEPVQEVGDAPHYLIQSIDLSPLADGQQLVFHAPGCEARFAMGMDPLRQWLAILHHLYLHATWDTVGVWPAGFDAAEPQTDFQVPAGTVFH